MALSFEEIRKAINEPKRRNDIQLALLHQERIRFHASTRLTADYMQPTADFFAFVQNLLPHDKFKIFRQLFRYPVKTNEICDTIFDKLSRIFDGRNPAFISSRPPSSAMIGIGIAPRNCMNPPYGKQKAGSSSRPKSIAC